MPKTPRASATMPTPPTGPILPKLGEVLTLRRRFLRSVSLERDARGGAGGSLDGYIPTPSTQFALSQIAGGLTRPSERAVSITGPYGTGKSAFALYLMNQLALPPFGTRTDGLFPVLITGGREPLVPALLNGLNAALSGQTALDTNEVTAKEAAKRFAQAAVTVRQQYPGCGGLLVVVDELGKFLEYAALHPERGDLQALQEIAEVAVRSENAPILFVTILHQAFDEYAHRLSSVQRAEWQKVQGRFLDLPFGDAAEDVLRLIGKAFAVTETAEAMEPFRIRAAEQARRCRELSLLPRGLMSEEGEAETAALFAGAFGLHPITLLALPHLFKRFGQSERTLFAFLYSDSPHGFGTFLREHSADSQYRPDQLYDYAIEAFGPALYTRPDTAKQWSQVQEAVYRCENRSGGLEARVVKTVGLLHLLGESARILPSREVVSFALTDTETTDTDISNALQHLTRTTTLVYRHHRRAYRPYEGSDIDVEERLREARMTLGEDFSPASIAQSRFPIAPIVARRHTFRKGTLRFFDVEVCVPEDLESVIDRENEEADGTLFLCLTSDSVEQMEAVVQAKALTARENDKPHIVAAIACVGESLYENALLVESLEWVRDNTDGLPLDPVAMRELEERLTEAIQGLEEEWTRLLLPEQDTVFVWQGDIVGLRGGGESLQHFLSDVSFKAYWRSPVLRNELLNRRLLSSTAAAARRNLVEAMILYPHLPHLGIEGYPAERMMYETVLAFPKLHAYKRESEEWGFQANLPKNHPSNLHFVWWEIEQFLLGGNLLPRPVNELYALLRSRPFGLTEGVMPVLLIAALLCWQDELLLYENGALITQLDPPTAERLLKRPQDYTIRGIRIAGERQAVIQRFGKGLLRPSEKSTIVNVVRSIYTQVRGLPTYSRSTKKLSIEARNLRDVLKEARSPEQLLFVELPETLGAKSFTTKPDEANVNAFFAAWNTAFTEIKESYRRLLDRINDALLHAFEVESSEEIRQRAQGILGRVLEPRLVAFVGRLADRSLEGEAWIESVAASIVGRPAEAWTDSDETRFLNSLSELISGFRNAELVAFAMDSARSDTVTEERIALRISVAEAGGHEDARVIVLSPHRAQQAENASEPLKKAMKRVLQTMTPEVRVAAIANILRELLREAKLEK